MLSHFLRVLLALCAMAERSFFESGAFTRGRGRLALEEVSSDDITVNEVMAALQELGIANGTGSALDPDPNPKAATASKGSDSVESEVSKDVVDILKEANTESTEAPSKETSENNNAEPGDADASETAPETSGDNNAEPGDADAPTTAPETSGDNNAEPGDADAPTTDNNAEPGDADAPTTAPETSGDNNAEPGDADAPTTADNSESEESGEKNVHPHSEASAERGVEHLGYQRFRAKQHKDVEDVSKFPAMVNALEERAKKVIMKSKRWKALLEKINQGHKNFTQLLKLFRLAVKRNHMAKVDEVATVLKSKGNASKGIITLHQEADVNVSIPTGHDVQGQGGQDREEDDKHAEELTKEEKQLFKQLFKDNQSKAKTETNPIESSTTGTDEDDADDDEPTDNAEVDPKPGDESGAAETQDEPEPSEEKKNQTNATVASANSSDQEKKNQTNATVALANSSDQEKKNQTNATVASANSSDQEKKNQTNATVASANSSDQEKKNQTNATVALANSSDQEKKNQTNATAASDQEKTGPPDCKNRKEEEKGSPTWCACNSKAELISSKEGCEATGGGRDQECEWSEKEVCVPKAS
ncbi:unnamed protein product [Cladocopium goreaui]|uniref:Uncharacterized protein n=1 Tax=Cladocopium goreaui TaxID=2562237 RepID=A0A9P1CUK4_9DINO|nr:unnamed protein product [Cladocopium goreaui]